MSSVIYTVYGEEEVKTKHCKECDQILPITEFRARGEGAGQKKRFYTICKTCERESYYVRKKIRAECPPKPESCESCGEKTNHLHLEHCHETNKFRGWVCEDCNTSIGRAGDNVTGILHILKYMIERDIDDEVVSINEYKKLQNLTEKYISSVRNILEKNAHG
jgi:protein-arginine kinase activator protein McsA